jgi:chromosome segregation ATPase
MKESLSKEVFEVHIQYTKEALEDLKKSVGLIFHKIDQQEKTLTRNTITVEQHEKRSLHIEQRQDESLKVIEELHKGMIAQKKAFEALADRFTVFEQELTPIKTHVKEVKKITTLFSLLYDNKILIVKIIVFITLILLGFYYGIDFKTLVRFVA